jgi:DNA-binding CsgD family transcriptional regulator
MSEDHELSCVVGRIYDAALDPALWTDALAKIAGFVGGRAGALGWKDLVNKFVNIDCHVGLDLMYMQMHSETYEEFNPPATIPLFDVGQVVSLPERMPCDDHCKGLLNQDRTLPQDRGDIAGAVLERPRKSRDFLSVVRSEANDMVDDEMRRRMTSLVPHLRRAMLIGKVLDRKRQEAKTFAETLDGLSTGLFFVDAKARIVHANAAAYDILNANDFLRSIDGRLVARDMQFDQALREIFATAERGNAEGGAKGIALPLHARDGEHYVAHLMPLTSGARRRYAAAAVFVRRAALENPALPETIGKTYQLTPAELRVLHAIVEKGGISEVAETLGIASTTVKTHLRHLFDKTGAGRQADLVKLVAGFSSPLAP